MEAAGHCSRRQPFWRREQLLGDLLLPAHGVCPAAFMQLGRNQLALRNAVMRYTTDPGGDEVGHVFSEVLPVGVGIRLVVWPSRPSKIA